jgi:serine protease Do
MIRKEFVAGAAVGAVASILAGAGGYWARAAEAGSVNNPAVVAAPGAPASFADIVERVSPAVVSIEVEGVAKAAPAVFSAPNGDDDDNPFGFDLRKMFPQGAPEAAPQKMRAAGSGFFVSADGYIVTNNHVVQDADKITVRTKDDREFKARLIGRDTATDLAVIKVEGGGFPFVSFEDRAKPRVGDWVVAVGNPFGLGGTATAGIVSALGRKNVSDSSYVDYMQIDAPINRGNSGGPTFDAYGRVVGVNTAIFSPSGGSVGIGFDIPSDVAASVTRQLVSDGKVVRGYIGATIQDVTPEIADSLGLPGSKGALVADLTPAGPSERAGLKQGDVVLKIDGHEVDSASDLTRRVAFARAGDTVRLDVRRDGQIREIDVRSGVRPTDAQLASADNGGRDAGPGESSSSRVLGMRLEPNAQGGLTIQGLRGDSDAQDKGLKPGDVILAAGGKKVSTGADLSAAVTAARTAGRKDVLLMVARDGRNSFVPLSIAGSNG